MGYLDANEQVKPRTEKVQYVDFAKGESLLSDPTTGMKFARVTMPGPIDQVEVPATWKKLDGSLGHFNDSYHAGFRNPSSPDVALGFHSSGNPHEEGTAYLNKLLAETNAKVIYSSAWEQQSDHVARGPRETKAKEIAQNLELVMGPSTVGSNQLTTGAGAATHLDKLETRVVNGKTILSAEGYYIDSVTKLPSAYFGMDFIPFRTPDGGTEIHTTAFTAGTKAAFTTNKAVYARVLNSIHWRNGGT
ncbi:MAG TPA: hypothetical protein V6C97_12590 [Oculatellaceae cyanobacterium]